MIRAVAGVAGLSVALVSSAPAPPGLVRLGEVLLFSATDLPADADAKAIAQLLAKAAPQAARTWRRRAMFQGDRGVTKDSMRSSGRSTRCRDAAGSQISEAASRATSNTTCSLPTRSERFLRSMSWAFTTRACDPIALKRSSSSSDRHCTLPWVTSGPISESCITRPSRETYAGTYVALFALTRASRDKYWPGGSDSDELRAAFKPVQGLTKELSTYLVDGSYLADPKFAAAVFESRQWADFVLVPTDPR